MEITPYDDINNLLDDLSKNLQRILGANLIGLYLIGSLTRGDFSRGSSDIDFLVVLNQTMFEDQLLKIAEMHLNIGEAYPEWRKRIEGSYITKEMLTNIKPPKEPRPYVNANKMYSLVYGNEWIINLYALYDSGITIFGADLKKLIEPINISEVREASKKNLLEEWQPKLKESTPFEEEDYDQDHLQAYAILTMCRILYMAKNENFPSKKVASEWVKKTYGKHWSDLIEKAENWKHSEEMNVQKESLKFIEFTVNEVERSDAQN